MVRRRGNLTRKWKISEIVHCLARLPRHQTIFSRDIFLENHQIPTNWSAYMLFACLDFPTGSVVAKLEPPEDWGNQLSRGKKQLRQANPRYRVQLELSQWAVTTSENVSSRKTCQEVPYQGGSGGTLFLSTSCKTTPNSCRKRVPEPADTTSYLH